MSQSTLKAKIIAEMIAVKGTPADASKLDEFAEAMSKAIIDWFEQDAQSLPGSFANGFGPVVGTGELQG